jgi:hypothetical protein
MGVRQRGASTAKISRPRHAARRAAIGRLSGQESTVGHPSGQENAVSAAGALGRSLGAAAMTWKGEAGGAWSTRLAPPLTPLTASHAPSHATSLAS